MDLLGPCAGSNSTVRAAGTLLPDPGGSRLHRLVIRHQGDVMHPIMSEKFTLEILIFLKGSSNVVAERTVLAAHSSVRAELTVQLGTSGTYSSTVLAHRPARSLQDLNLRFSRSTFVACVQRLIVYLINRF